MKIAHRSTSVAILFLGIATSVWAQRPRVDPRPLQGKPELSLPQWGINPGDHAASGGLQRFGRDAGKATITWTTVPPADIRMDPDKSRLQRQSPTIPPATRVHRRANGTVNWMRGAFGYSSSFEAAGPAITPSFSGFAASRVQGALGFASVYRSVFGIADPAAELVAASVVTDELGYTHCRFDQVFKGVPVWGRDLTIHTNAAGAIFLVNGSYEPTPTAVDVTPVVTPERAFAIVVKRLNREGRFAEIDPGAISMLGMAPSIRTVLFPDPQHGMRIAYEVQIHPNLVEYFTFIIDGSNGGILTRIANHCSLIDHDRPAPIGDVRYSAPERHGKQGPSLASAGTFASATGTDLNGQSRSIRTYQGDDGTYYFVWDLPNLNLAGSSLPDKPQGGAQTLSLRNQDLSSKATLYHVTSGNNSWDDRSSVSAHYNMKVAYDYYKDTHGRKAIDDQDASIISIIHGTEDGRPMDNAYWNGRVMVYGDGDQVFKPLAGGLDVAGHEMSHGVIGSSAGLIYQFQSGALNESFADVFGSMVDRDDWFMGEDVVLPGKGSALRDMANPANTSVVSPQPGHMNDFRNLGADQDNGGVHVNSGIPNKACYNVAQSLGREKTEKIYYRALTKYLNRNSNFVDCRTACEQAATDLYGAADAQAVGNAFGAVGIGPVGGSDPGGDDVPPAIGGKPYVAFVAGNGQVGLLDLATNQYALFTHPDAVARVNQNTGDRAQVSAPLTGSALYFIGSTGRLVSIRASDGAVTVFDISLQSPGDLWNAAISPDDNYVALVSAYSDDPTLYISDGSQVAPIPLLPESSQDGIEDNSIQYPDAISWSRNWNEPRIAFDALNTINVDGEPYSYWGVYEIDFEAQTIYNLVPAQPAEISLGNITYSNTDPDVVAFNVISPANVWDIVIGDLTGNGLEMLGIPSMSIGGGSVTDAARPTFSTDDRILAFTSESAAALLYLDLQTKQVGGVTFPAPIYNPYWFVLGGQIPGLDAPADASVDGSVIIRPNPVAETGVIEWLVRRPGPVVVDVIDLQGRMLTELFQGIGEVGQMNRAVNLSGYPAGTYVVRVKDAAGTRYIRFVIAR